MDDHHDEWPKVTLRHLLQAERLCAFRLSREHRNDRGNRGGTARFRVGGQITEDARLAHATCAAPEARHFQPSPDLREEQRRIYLAAAAWYVQLFGESRVEVLDDDFDTHVPALGIRLVGPAGLLLRDESGGAELRLLRMGRVTTQRGAASMRDDPEVRFALARHEARLGAAPVRVVMADLLHGSLADETIEMGEATEMLHTWLDERVAAIRTCIEEPEPRVGIECGWCPFIARCQAHR